MGLTRASIYLDSCLVIYFVEEHPRYVTTIIHAMESRSGMCFPDYKDPSAKHEKPVIPAGMPESRPWTVT